MLFNDIVEASKKQSVHVFFDMDGTLAELDIDKDRARYKKGSNYYVDKRPLISVIKVAENLSKMDNITVHILSNCPLKEQISQKTNWLKKFAPFFEEKNIHIICYENISFTKQEKPFLKGNFIKEMIKGPYKCFLIEDDHSNINATNTFENIEAYHVTCFIE